jgi:hypothetical protein
MRRVLTSSATVSIGRRSIGAEVSVSAGTTASAQKIATPTIGRFQKYKQQYGRGTAVYISLTGEVLTAATCYVLHKRLLVDGDTVTLLQAGTDAVGEMVGTSQPVDWEYYGNKQLSFFGIEGTHFYARLIPNYLTSTLMVPALAFVHVPFCVVTGKIMF